MSAKQRDLILPCVNCMPVIFVMNPTDILPLHVAVNHDISYIQDTFNDYTQSLGHIACGHSLSVHVEQVLHSE